MKFTLDTNVYIDGLRDPSALATLEEFVARATSGLYLSSVVLQELLAGAATGHEADLLERQVAGPFERRGRLFTPSVAAWRRCGRVMANLSPSGAPLARSVPNDLLIALSCREQGITLITRDRGFRRLAPHVPGFREVVPFPSI